MNLDSFLSVKQQSDQGNKRPIWVWRFAVVVMLVTTIPYFLGYFSQGDSWHFTGFVFGVEDGNSYIAKMLRGASGDWLFRTPYTALPQGGVLAFLPYLLLGKLTSPPGQHIELVVMFHYFRVGAGILAIVASYDFLCLFVEKARWRRWGLLLASLGGGLGWVLVLLGQGDWLGSLPLDFYSPETFGFLALYGLPHLALARALLLWGLRAYLRPDLIPHPRWAGWITGALWLLMGLMQPLTVVLAWTVIGSHVLLMAAVQLWRRWNRGYVDWDEWLPWLWRAVQAGLVSAPLALYTAWTFRLNPILRQWKAKSLLPSPPPGHYLVAYGLFLPAAFIVVWQLIKAGPSFRWLLVSWSFLFPVLIYIPFPFQRRLAEGYWVALIALVIIALEMVPERVSKRLQGLLALTLPTTLLLFVGGVQVARQPAEPVFRPTEEVAVFRFLAEETQGKAVVLASYETGNALPAWAPVFIVLGHGPESVGLSDLRPEVESFYRSETPEEERMALLDAYDVDYVFWGPAERALGDWDPHKNINLQVVHEQDGYAVFMVSKE
jgi:hypothetical protein